MELGTLGQTEASIIPMIAPLSLKLSWYVLSILGGVGAFRLWEGSFLGSLVGRARTLQLWVARVPSLSL